MDKDYFAVYERVVRFMTDQKISCEETIYQFDRVIENAYEFLGELYELVEHDPRIKAMQGEE